MSYIVKYVKQESVDHAKQLIQREPTAEEVEQMKYSVKTPTEGGAIRLVDMLRSTGHIATYYEETELGGDK